MANVTPEMSPERHAPEETPRPSQHPEDVVNSAKEKAYDDVNDDKSQQSAIKATSSVEGPAGPRLHKKKGSYHLHDDFRQATSHDDRTSPVSPKDRSASLNGVSTD